MSYGNDKALKLLKAGNERFQTGKHINLIEGKSRRKALVQGQKPFAAILACADSRVSPSIIFDQGLGDIFVTRVAGNIADEGTLGSLEFAVKGLGVGLIVVLGHESCGAVNAAIEKVSFSPSLDFITKTIRSHFGEKCPANLDQGVELNVKGVVADLSKRSKILSDAMKAGKLKVVGGVYHLKSGKVEFSE